MWRKRCAVTSAGNSQCVANSAVTPSNTYIPVYLIILWLGGWMAHRSWHPVHSGCIQTAYWEGFLAHANLQTIPGCCLGECKFPQVKTMSREHWAVWLITRQCWVHILPSPVYFIGADHVNLQSSGRWLAILNSHQEAAAEQSVWHFCADGISDASGIT